MPESTHDEFGGVAVSDADEFGGVPIEEGPTLGRMEEVPETVGSTISHYWDKAQQKLVTLAPRFNRHTVPDALDVMDSLSPERFLAPPGVIVPDDLSGPSREPTLAEQRATGVYNATAEAVNSMTSPVGIATLGMGVLPKAAQVGITAAFLGQTAKQTEEAAKQAGEVSVTGTPEQKAEAYTSLGIQPAMGAMIGHQGAKLLQPRMPVPGVPKGPEPVPEPGQPAPEVLPAPLPRTIEKTVGPDGQPIEVLEINKQKKTALVRPEGQPEAAPSVVPLSEITTKEVPVEVPAEQKGPNASSEQKAATVYGDMRTPAGEGEGKVPVTEGERRIQSQTGGGLRQAEAQASEVPLKEEMVLADPKADLKSRLQAAKDVAAKVMGMTPEQFLTWNKLLREKTGGGATNMASEPIGEAIAKSGDITFLGVLKERVAKADEQVSRLFNEITEKASKLPEGPERDAIVNQMGQFSSFPQFFREAVIRAEWLLSDGTAHASRFDKPTDLAELEKFRTEQAERGRPAAPFSGYQYGLATFETPGARPGWKSHVTAETARKGGYSVPEKYPTEAEWKATQDAKGNEAVPSNAPRLLIDPFGVEAGRMVGRAIKDVYDSPVAKKVRDEISNLWNAAALKSAPRLTQSNRALGEAGVRYASSFMVGRTKGQIFADKVLAGTGIDPVKFGTALAEDNLRSVRASKTDPAEAAKVRTLVGDESSPFKTEEEYQAFLNDPVTKAAIEKHKALWSEQKDPLYRQANDLDPDLPLVTRGLQTGARINLKALKPDEAGVAPIGRSRPPGFRQLSTLKRRDPFGRKASGAGQAYEGHYNEIMANGFERELPVAAQHEFLKQLIDNGDAIVSDKMNSDAPVKGEDTTGYLLNLKPWTGKFIHVRKGLTGEFENISGLDKPLKLPLITAFNNFMTRQSVAGLAEGTTHASNLMTQIFTMPGPTANPMLNALLKSLGRADLLISIPRVIIKGFSNQRERMLELAEIGAAKEPYPGAIAKKILNPIDQGVRLVSDDIYKGLAEKGIVENNETARREFINQVGQYNKRLQPLITRKLRETGLSPFITAGQTFNVQGVRRLALGAGVKATNNARALALKADVAAGWMGAIALVTTLNLITSGKATGPLGTPLGAVGWVGDDKKVHNFNLMRLLGYERGLRVTGIGPAVEAKRLGLSTQQAVKAGAEAVTSAGLNMVAGPGPRFVALAATGLRPTQPWIKEAKTVPPTDSLSPLKTQLAENIKTAVVEANPVLSSGHEIYKGVKEGKPAGEIVQRTLEKQASRYTPRTGMTEQTAKALPKIVDTRQLLDYTDEVAREARKLPINKRYNYIRKRFNEDELAKKFRDPAWNEIKKKGVLKYK